MKLLVALGGNALLKRGEFPSTSSQRENTRMAARALEKIAREHQLILSHGNGPQVGLLAMQAECYAGAEAYPFDVMCAATAGMIGYMIEQELGNLLGYDVPIATLLTRVAVDPDDPEFSAPTKFVGTAVDDDEAETLSNAHGWQFRRDGDKLRRVVPSPTPQRIIWHRPIRWLLDNHAVVICAGGGGIPVVHNTEDDSYRGVEAVIDKDRASGLLASEIPSDMFVIATDVDGVYLDYGTDRQRVLRRTTPAELDALNFSSGSMGPKVDAACLFVRRTGKPAVIGSLDHIADIVAGISGTWIEPDAD